MSKLAIIPARGGSKRIPRKNIRDFLGKPIIAYSITAALESGLFDEVMVSTDDEEIAEVAIKFGAKIPFLRSEEASSDYATTAQVIAEVLEKYEEVGASHSYACCIYPSAPFVTKQMLAKAYDLLIEGQFDTVFPVLRYSYPIWRSFNMEKGKVKMNWPEHAGSRSQDLPDSFHDSGQFYWFNINAFNMNKVLFTDNSGAIELPEVEVQDIDNEVDWVMAEIKYKVLHKLN